MTKPKLSAFAQAARLSAIRSRNGTQVAQRLNIIQSPSLPVFRLHHQDRKEKQPCQ